MHGRNMREREREHVFERKRDRLVAHTDFIYIYIHIKRNELYILYIYK